MAADQKILDGMFVGEFELVVCQHLNSKLSKYGVVVTHFPAAAVGADLVGKVQTIEDHHGPAGDKVGIESRDRLLPFIVGGHVEEHVDSEDHVESRWQFELCERTYQELSTRGVSPCGFDCTPGKVDADDSEAHPNQRGNEYSRAAAGIQDSFSSRLGHESLECFDNMGLLEAVLVEILSLAEETVPDGSKAAGVRRVTIFPVLLRGCGLYLGIFGTQNRGWHFQNSAWCVSFIIDRRLDRKA